MGAMTHDQIRDSEVIERYVLHKLPPAERLAFQEHFFECDECFEQTNVAARFIAGVRDASRSGVLAANYVPSNEAGALTSRLRMLRPLLAFSFAASLLFAVALAWLWFSRVPELRREIASERGARQESEKEAQRTLENSRQQLEEKQRQLEIERAEGARLKAQLDQIGNRPPDKDLIALANIPSVTLESSRDSGTTENQLNIPARTKKVLLSIPVELGRFPTFMVQILTKSQRPVDTVMAAKPNRRGSLAVSVPAGRLESGAYLVKLYGRKGAQQELLAEYDLRVVKK